MSLKEGQKKAENIKRNPIFLILENIIDTYNVGGFFRLAEALAVEKMYLCGRTETPPNTRIAKSSVGNYKLVPWEYCPNATEAIRRLGGEGGRQGITPQVSADSTCGVEELAAPRTVRVYAVEQNERAIDYRKPNYHFPMAFVFGNESYGVRPETLKLVDAIVEIPMYGLNKSLNVMVAAGIVTYWALNQAGLP